MREIFLSDIHYPYEDVAAEGLALRVLKELQPDLIHLGGDIIDNVAFSRHDKKPQQELEGQAHIDYTRRKLQKIRSLTPNARIEFKEGNHETMLPRYLRGNARSATALRDLHLPNLLGLKELDISWIPNMAIHQVGKLYHVHGNEANLRGGVHVAKGMYMKYHANVIFGHFHRLQSYIQTRYQQADEGAWANPCLCNKQVDYEGAPNWQHGFSIIDYGKSGVFHVDQIPILRRGKELVSCFVYGREFEFDGRKR